MHAHDPSTNVLDAWLEWLQFSRHGGVAEYAAAQLPQIQNIRDRVLLGAEIEQDSVVADLGCGDGLMGLAVLEKHPSAHVIFVDISPALVSKARERAEALGALNRSEFIVSSLQSLRMLRDRSVDIVFARAVLAYIEQKDLAINEIFRILRPAGQVSLADPIMQDVAFYTVALKRLVERGEATPRAQFMYRCLAAQFPDSLDEMKASPTTSYNERTLATLFEISGFVDIRLRLHIDILLSPPMPWEAFINAKPYAGVPSIKETLEEQFSAEDKIAFESLFHDIVEGGGHTEKTAVAYLTACKPR